MKTETTLSDDLPFRAAYFYFRSKSSGFSLLLKEATQKRSGLGGAEMEIA